MEKIDFVITWVDDSDPKWLKEKQKYTSNSNNDDRKVRYRNYDLLKYWFRSVEKYANWVNKIYFVTYGHIPKWLNTNNKKLVIVNHKDFIPEKYLPTFNSGPIELNLYKIKGLSENFVYFNDDMFITSKVKPIDFFKNNLPRDFAVLNAIIPTGKDYYEHRLLNNSILINKHFKMKEVIKKHPFKWFNIRYGKTQIRTLLLLPFCNFSLIKFSHYPVSYKKESFKKIWELDPKMLDLSCQDKIRSINGVNSFVIENYQKVAGQFIPRSPKFGKYFLLSNNNDKIIKSIKKQKYKVICINDSDEINDFEKVKKQLIEAFEVNLSEKSSFEK